MFLENLKDHLVWAKLCKVDYMTGGMFKCFLEKM